jgi:GcrA cell cycle regulator
MREWPQEHIDYLIANWGSGESASQIGVKLDGRSKSSVVGKAHRMGLPRLGVTPLPKGQRRRQRQPPKHVPPGSDTLPRPPCLQAPAATIPTKRTRTPPPKPWVPTIHPCCWPEGEPRTPSFRYCDEPSEHGRPYCATHLKLAYVKRRREDAAQ